jgi:hypothetical protein
LAFKKTFETMCYKNIDTGLYPSIILPIPFMPSFVIMLLQTLLRSKSFPYYLIFCSETLGGRGGGHAVA